MLCWIVWILCEGIHFINFVKYWIKDVAHGFHRVFTKWNEVDESVSKGLSLFLDSRVASIANNLDVVEFFVAMSSFKGNHHQMLCRLTELGSCRNPISRLDVNLGRHMSAQELPRPANHSCMDKSALVNIQEVKGK